MTLTAQRFLASEGALTTPANFVTKVGHSFIGIGIFLIVGVLFPNFFRVDPITIILYLHSTSQLFREWPYVRHTPTRSNDSIR